MPEAGASSDIVDRTFGTAEIGALAHLYRGEIYRSTIWRTRLDNTTNWSIVTMGIALSTTFSSRDASPLPLVLVGLLLAAFLAFESRRYRYFNVWRARARWMELHFYAPMLCGETAKAATHWADVLARDYRTPRHHISFARAVGRRLRRTYLGIFAIQSAAYLGKIAIHPTPAVSWGDLAERASIGPAPGSYVLCLGALYDAAWVALAIVTFYLDSRDHKGRRAGGAMG